MPDTHEHPSLRATAATGRDIRTLLELASELFCVIDRDGRFVASSPGWTRVLGWSPEDLAGRAALDLVHPHDLPTCRELLHRAPHEEIHVEQQHIRVRHRDGSYRWLSWTGRPRDDRWYGAARDVTTQRMSHEALQRSERRSRAILAALREGLVVVNSAGRVTEANQRFAAMVDRPLREIIGATPPYPWWPAEDRALLSDSLRETLTAPRLRLDLTFVRADGGRFPVRIDASELRERGNDDNERATLTVVRDVSEFVRARDSARLHDAVLSALEVAVVWCCPAERQITANDAAGRLLGWTEPQPRTLDDLGALTAPQPAGAEFMTALREGRRWEGALTLQRADGSPVAVLARTTVVGDDAGAPHWAAAVLTRADRAAA